MSEPSYSRLDENEVNDVTAAVDGNHERWVFF